MGSGVARLPLGLARRCRAAAIALALAGSLGGCGFAEVFCGNAVGTCDAQIDDIRTVARTTRAE